MSMLSGAIWEFYNSTTMYLAHNMHKNKVNVDLECLFLLHINDRDRCGSLEILLLSNLGIQSC